MSHASLSANDVTARMDRIYRPQRYIYDLTRKYYLLGRDRALAEMAVRPGQTVLEIGCGTGRNLVQLAQRYPDARLVGVEPSSAMLETARAAVGRAGRPITLLHGTAEEVCREGPLADGADHVLFSYVLSMIAEPARTIDRALELCRPGAVIHVIDFGDMAGLPSIARSALRAWLRCFHVHPRPDAARHLARLEVDGRGRLTTTRIAGGYAELLRLRLP